MTTSKSTSNEVHSVQTVKGPTPLDELGTTLMHEHIILDASKLFNTRSRRDNEGIEGKNVCARIIGDLRYNPHGSIDNLQLDDIETAIEEVREYGKNSGKTIVEMTSKYNGRNPAALKEISDETGMNIVMGCGFYLECTYPEVLKRMSIDSLKEEVLSEIEEGVDGQGTRPGIIGEAGVSRDATPLEIKMLRAQSRAQATANLPLSIHLDGWQRQAKMVLDIVGEEGANLKKVILCHMNPSYVDLDYQLSLAEKGVFLEYDMIGNDFYYPEYDSQSPSDWENAFAIKRLIDAGFISQLLVSQDVYLKMMLKRYGGFGYAHLCKHFLPRLRRLGVDDMQIDVLMVKNPKLAFS